MGNQNCITIYSYKHHGVTYLSDYNVCEYNGGIKLEQDQYINQSPHPNEIFEWVNPALSLLGRIWIILESLNGSLDRIDCRQSRNRGFQICRDVLEMSMGCGSSLQRHTIEIFKWRCKGVKMEI